ALGGGSAPFRRAALAAARLSLPPPGRIAPAQPALGQREAHDNDCAGEAGARNYTIDSAPAVYTVSPFVAMLLAIAVCPLRVPQWWDSNRDKFIVSAVLGAPVLALYLQREPAALVRMAEEYV